MLFTLNHLEDFPEIMLLSDILTFSNRPSIHDFDFLSFSWNKRLVMTRPFALEAEVVICVADLWLITSFCIPICHYLLVE